MFDFKSKSGMMEIRVNLNYWKRDAIAVAAVTVIDAVG